MSNKQLDACINVLLEGLKQGYHGKAWHGTTLKGSVRGLKVSQALWRPGALRHNIWEIVLHCAYWKYAVRRRITGEKIGSFPLKGSNWIKLPSITDEKSWKTCLALLDDMHNKLIEVVAGLPASGLEIIPANSKVPNRITIIGIAAHDLYHTGQIQLIKKLMHAKPLRF